MNAPLRLAAVLAAAAMLAGCGRTSDDAEQQSLTALAPTPTAAAASPTPNPTVPCSNPTASLRPAASLPAPGHMPAGSYMERIRRRGRLIAGVDQNTLRFAYLRPSTATIEGFEVDFLREIARAIFGDSNLSRLDLRAVTTAQRLPAVRSGAVDILADAATITCYRRTLVDFSTVYYQAALRLLVPASSRARSLGDLGGKRVCATAGSTTLQYLAKYPSHPIPSPVDQRTDCLVYLQQNKVDAIAADDTILLGFRAQDPNTKLIGPRLEEEPYGMAIKKGNPDFVRFVNGVLERMRRDGAWQRIHRRWLGDLAPATSPPAPRYR
jgi:polar amino acid transport system substrate-binding protein